MIIYLALNNSIVLFNKVLRHWIEEAEKEGITRLSSQLCMKAITIELDHKIVNKTNNLTQLPYFRYT